MAQTSSGLSLTAQRVLAQLIDGNEFARPALAHELDLSTPTVGTVLADLRSRNLVEARGSLQGALGRSATVFGLHSKAGWLLGIDVGSTQIVTLARRLDGTLIGEIHRSRGDEGDDVRFLALARSVIDQSIREFSPRYGPLLAVGIALPRVIPPRISADTVLGIGGTSVTLRMLIEQLGIPAGVACLVENNANCSALAEMSIGRARTVDTFAFVQLGVRVGAAVVAGGRLRRGAHGASGEVSEIPFPFAPEWAPERTTNLEKFLGSDAVLARAAERWADDVAALGVDGLGAPPSSMRELIDLAAVGNPIAVSVIEQQVATIVGMFSTIAAVLDPEIIVIGGGVGQNVELFERIRALSARIGLRFELVASSLGDRSTVEGACTLAIEFARSQVLADSYRPRVDVSDLSITAEPRPGAAPNTPEPQQHDFDPA